MKFLLVKIDYKNIEKKAELQQKQIVLSFSIRHSMKVRTVFSTVESLQNRLKNAGKSNRIAFVPTMGALHQGHIELVKQALDLSETVIVSIFVNPTQFNSKEDLQNYPRTLENDLKLLEMAGDVIVFAPTVEEMYPSTFKTIDVELGELANVMEGKFRPGHFSGVMNVVHRFFEIVQPTFALFGEKDFQQLAVIRRMVEQLKLDVQIVPCETIRETSGLARSSRNQRLNSEELEDALIIIQSMRFAQSIVEQYSPQEVAEKTIDYFNKGKLRLEYLEIVNPVSLQSINEWTLGARICIAAYCGEVRLIDNMELIK
jgi:pantoate--beta-alanine ligase